MKKHISPGLIAATVVALIIILLSINYFKGSLEKRYTSNIYSRLSELSSNNAASITSKISYQMEMMHTLSTYLADEDLRGEGVLSMINKTVEPYGFLRCAITFPDGSFITHDSKNEGNTLKEEHVIKGFQGISSVTGPMPAVVDKAKTVILLTVPIYQEQQIIALLTCTYETKYLETVFQMTSFDGKGYSYITNADGGIISKPDMEGLIYYGENIMTFFRSEFQDSYYKMRDDMHEMSSGTVLLQVGGELKYVSYQPLGLNQWYIFSVTSGEVLDSQLNSMLNSVYHLAMVIIITLLLLLLLIWFYIYRMQEKAKKKLQKLAYYDGLTNMPNNLLFEKEVRRILDTAPGEYAYLILNINKFKLINDVFGFAQGDLLLQHIASVLNHEAGANEVCARFSADNFHILSSYFDKETLENRMLSVSEKITGFQFDKKMPHKLTIGFGAYIIEDKTMEISPMGDKALMALSKIKGFHSAVTYFYNDEIMNQFMAEQEIENTMQDALENGEMKLYLQPKCSAQNYQILGAEALVRWHNPVKGLILPDNFIPLFEKNGFIVKLDMYMVECACKLLREWQDKHLYVVAISVNQSRNCLYQSGYVNKLLQILRKYDVSPALIELEITERAFFDDELALINIIEHLHQYGFKVAMDDFGAGYSSLNMLQDVLVDVLKIDKNFFRESINSERGKKIVSNIVAMANDLNIEVVAEGIETKEQLDFLKEIHCGSVQGYYFSKPVPVDVFERNYCEALLAGE